MTRFGESCASRRSSPSRYAAQSPCFYGRGNWRYEVADQRRLETSRGIQLHRTLAEKGKRCVLRSIRSCRPQILRGGIVQSPTTDVKDHVRHPNDITSKAFHPTPRP